MLQFKPPPADYSIARSDDDLGKQLEQLGWRVGASNDPPIAEIESVLQKYLSIGTLPVNKPSPTAQDKRAVELGLLAFFVIVSCQWHLQKNTKLGTCLLNAWPAIWRWLQFLSNQCCRMQKYGSGSIFIQALVTIPSTIEMMSHSKVLRHKMASTPGVVAMITGYWMTEGSVSTMESLFAAAGTPHPFTTALNILIHPDNRPSACLPEFITAVPGGAKSAAAHAIRQLHAVVEQEPPHFRTIMRHIILIRSLSSAAAPNILLELLCQGVVPSTVKTLVWLEKQSTSTPDDEETACKCVNTCFMTLNTAMMCSNGPSWVIQALDAGILPAALKSAPRIAQLERPLSLQCSALLSDFLCQYLVYRSVVRSAAKALRRTERLNIDSSLGGPIWEAWVVFEALARDRIALKGNLAEKESKSQKCHRVDCRTVMDSDDLLRCTGCISAIYCDRACQKMDWPLHKIPCKKKQQLLRDGIVIPMSSGEATFIREIVFKDIWENGELMKALLTAHLDNQSSRRSSSEFAFHFDYTQVPSRMRVVPTSCLNGMSAEVDKTIEDCLRSEGRMMVAKVEVQRGSMSGTLAYPFPTTRM